MFYIALGRFTAKFCSIEIGFKKKNANLKMDLHVALWLFWENESRSEELEEVSFKLNKTVENKFLHDTNSSTGNLFQVWKRTWKQKRKKMTFFKHVRVNGSMHAISFSTNNSITNFYPSPYWGLVGAQLIITGSWVVSWVGKGFSFVLISKSTIR